MLMSEQLQGSRILHHSNTVLLQGQKTAVYFRPVLKHHCLHLPYLLYVLVTPIASVGTFL